jgi:hypothetical protein
MILTILETTAWRTYQHWCWLSWPVRLTHTIPRLRGRHFNHYVTYPLNFVFWWTPFIITVLLFPFYRTGHLRQVWLYLILKNKNFKFLKSINQTRFYSIIVQLKNSTSFLCWKTCAEILLNDILFLNIYILAQLRNKTVLAQLRNFYLSLSSPLHWSNQYWSHMKKHGRDRVGLEPMTWVERKTP